MLAHIPQISENELLDLPILRKQKSGYRKMNKTESQTCHSGDISVSLSCYHAFSGAARPIFVWGGYHQTGALIFGNQTNKIMA